MQKWKEALSVPRQKKLSHPPLRTHYVCSVRPEIHILPIRRRSRVNSRYKLRHTKKNIKIIKHKNKYVITRTPSNNNERTSKRTANNVRDFDFFLICHCIGHCFVINKLVIENNRLQCVLYPRTYVTNHSEARAFCLTSPL